MNFWLSLVGMAELDQLAELVPFAEEMGYYGVTVADHLVMPTRIASRYPYTEDGEVFWPDDNPWPDPWVMPGLLAGRTRKLKLASNIYLAALRDPFTAAKSVATASVLSGGRVVCGVAAGWIREEYQLLNIDFDRRGSRLDETIAVMRQLWSGVEVSHQGEHFSFKEARMLPAPASSVPIWCGGMSPPALRRAATLCDGWLGLPMTAKDLLATVDHLHALRRDAGLALDSYEVAGAMLEAPTPERCAELEEHGVRHLMSISPWFPSPWGESYVASDEDPRLLDTKKKAIERFAGSVIHKLNQSRGH